MCVNVSPAEEHAALTKTALEYANMATRIRVALKPKPQAMPMGGSDADGLLANQAALALLRSEHELAEAQTRVEELSAMNGVLHRRLAELARVKEAQTARFPFVLFSRARTRCRPTACAANAGAAAGLAAC